MTVAGEPYVQEREGVLYVGVTRVALSSLIGAWLTEGYTAEEAQAAFPALTLAQVYGAIAFYLERRSTLDAAYREEAETYERLRAQDRQNRPDFFRALDERRTRLRQRATRPAQESQRESGEHSDQAPQK